MDRQTLIDRLDVLAHREKVTYYVLQTILYALERRKISAATAREYIEQEGLTERVFGEGNKAPKDF